MIYGYAVVVQQVEKPKDRDHAWRAFIIQDAKPNEDSPNSCYGYAATEHGAILEAFSKVEFKDPN